jgi:hypothetical protein
MLNEKNVNPAQVSAEMLKAQAAQEAKAGRRIGEDFYENVVEGVINGDGKKIKNYFENILADFSPIGFAQRTRDLEEQAAKLRNTLGLGVEKSREFSQMIADNAGKFTEFGYDVDDVVKTYEDLFQTFKTNISISNEDLLELKNTASVTSVEVSDIASGFRDVGASISVASDRLLEVTNIAKDAGVAVSSVAKGVMSNLDKMNMYNFEGGVKGLAKMSAQAARLNINMDSIFSVVDKVFNPEGAIELAAGLQRLGVQTNALLDPLRMMDLAQNDPTELQNQIVGMTKDFVRFNKELGQFEIMPGEKRRLAEIGKELGMANGEIQKMALNAANLDYKMKQIRFPSSIASKEDRELIATLAQVNKQGVAEVKVERVDKDGKPLGEYDMVAVENLTDEQIKGLKQQQSHGLTMEDLQKQQLTESKRQSQLLEAMLVSFGYGISGSKPARAGYEFLSKGVRENIFQEPGRKPGEPVGFIGEEFRNSEIVRRATESSYDMVKDVVKSFLNEKGLPTDITGIKEQVYKLISDNLPSMGDITDILPDMSSITDLLKNVIPIGGSETDPFTNFQNITQSLNTITENTSTQINQVSNFNKLEFKPLEIKEEMKVSLDVKLDPDSKNQALTQLMTTALELFFQGGENKTNIDMVIKEMEKIKTNQGLTLNQPKESLVNMPGKDNKS